MKQLLVLLSALCVCTMSYGQKTVSISLDKGASTLDYLDLQEHGFILKTGKEKNYSKNLDWQLHYYTPALELVWSVPIATTQINKNQGQHMVATPNGDYVYHIENRLYALGAADMFLTQVSRQGKTKTHELALKEMEGRAIFRFCDKQYLTFINLQEDATKDGSDLLLVYKMSHQDFSLQKTVTQLPLLDKSFIAWEYVAHNDKHLWMAGKALSDKEENMQCQLVALDAQGKVTQKITLNHQVDGLHMRQSVNHHYIPGAEGFSDGGVSAGPTTSMYGASRTSYHLDRSAFAGLLMDEKNHTVYAYGLYGNNKGIGTGYVDGYYLTAYDLQGNKRWQQVSEENDPLVQDTKYRKHTSPYQRTTMAYLTQDHHMRLQLGTVDAIYTQEFAKDGKKVVSYRHDFEKGVGYNTFFKCFDPKGPANQYYHQHFSKKNTYYGIHSSKGSVLVEDSNKSKISLLQW